MKKWKITNDSGQPITLHIGWNNSISFNAYESIITSDELLVNASKQFRQFIIEDI